MKYKHITFEQANFFGIPIKDIGESKWYFCGGKKPSKANTFSAAMEEANKKGKILAFTAPEQYQVVDWLLEKHGIWVNASPVFQFNDGREDYLQIQGWQYYITVITDNKYNQEKSHADRETKSTSQEAYSAAFDYIKNNNLI